MKNYSASFWGKLLAIGTFIISLIAVIMNFNDVADWFYKTKILYIHAQDVEHLIQDKHQYINELSRLKRKIDRTELETLKQREISHVLRKEIDSLETVIKIISVGKEPLRDSVWIETRAGWKKVKMTDVLK